MTTTVIEEVRLKSNVHIISILELKMLAEINEHASLYIKAYIRETEDDLINSFITLYSEKGDNNVIFSGYIVDFNIRHNSGEKIIEINCQSFTFLLDQEKKRRIFQNTCCTYETLLKKILNKQGKVFIAHRNNDVVGQIYLQYDETDWEFLKRIAARMHEPIVPDIISDFPNALIGFSGKKYHTLDDQKEYQLCFDFYTNKMLCILHHSDQFDLGMKIIFNNKKWIITCKKAELVNSKLELTYRLEREQYLEMPEIYNEKIRGLLIYGTVKEVNGPKLKVKLDMESEFERERAYDFGYDPLSGNIMQSMPECGARVAVYCPTSDENDSFVESCFFETASTYPDSQKKILQFNRDKILYADESELVTGSLSGGNQLRIVDSKGIMWKTKKRIKIKAEQKITLRCRGICSIIAEKGISIADSKDSSLSMDGSELVLHAPQIITSGLPPVFKVPLPNKGDIIKASKSIPRNFAAQVLGGIPVNVGNEVNRMISGAIPDSCYPLKPPFPAACILHIKESGKVWLIIM